MRSIDKDNMKFHIGDLIKPRTYNETHPIVDITEKGYVLDIGMTIPFKDEDVWEVARHLEEEKLDGYPKDIEANAVMFCFDKGINITPYQAKLIASHYLRIGHNEGYLEGRKNAHIPARELGLPKSMDFQQDRSNVDLEKEIERYFAGWTDSPDYSQALNAEGECVSTEEIIDIVRHFVSLALNTGETSSNKTCGGYKD